MKRQVLACVIILVMLTLAAVTGLAAMAARAEATEAPGMVLEASGDAEDVPGAGGSTLITTIALAVSLVLAGALFLMNKKGIIKGETLTTVNEVIDKAEQLFPPGSVVALFAYYASEAVHAVEQLVKKGEVEKDDAARKTAASESVKEFAAADGMVLTDVEWKVVNTLIEGQIDKQRQAQ